MGLPEVADFARKFAVMIRVQGPDPKGLKMRNHAFHHYNSGKTTLSASGMLFPGSFGSDVDSGNVGKTSHTIFVLTVASVIEPFVLQKYRERNAAKVHDKPPLVSGVQIDILIEEKSMVGCSMEALPWFSAELVKLVDIPQSSAAVQSLLEASLGSMENGWEVGWSLASHARGSQHTDNPSTQVEQPPFQNHWPVLGVESNNPTAMGQSTSRIALLAINSKLPMDLPKLQIYVPKRGDLLLAMGSPFGILSPLHFFNNASLGSIGNNYPPNSATRSLLMADIRCLPGMEGSPVFSEHAQFIGLLTRPLRQKNSGTEIQLVIPWEAIASACNKLLQEDCHITWKMKDYSNGNLNLQNRYTKGYSGEFPNNHSLEGSEMPSPVEKATNSVCLITTEDGTWASGILLNKHGLVLTNAHLLEPWRFGKHAPKVEKNESKTGFGTIPRKDSLYQEADAFSGENSETSDIYSTYENSAPSKGRSGYINNRHVRVRLDFLDPWMWTDARVVYISRGPLDVALLQLEVVPDQLCPIIMDTRCPSPGSKAYVIGHGLFGPRCDIHPSVCLGVIAKVIKAKSSQQLRTNELKVSEEFPAMLETTAAVHPGSSGGSVVDSDGHMIGLITSNAKHGGGTVIPHLNFSIPCAALQPILKFSQEMEDFTILEELDKPNEHLSSIWALVPPLYPKPEPLLPNIPQLPEHKDTKGSRFAKFIAERNELLRKPAQHGMSGKSYTDALIHSKL